MLMYICADYYAVTYAGRRVTHPLPKGRGMDVTPQQSNVTAEKLKSTH
jgi:hypothetical protein